MNSDDALRSAFRDPAPQSAKHSKRRERRARRADATRRQALSPFRILTSVLLVPVIAGGLTVSIYTRTSPFEREDALRHLVAMTGCSAAAAMGVGRAARGDPGYHPHHDPDGDGIACNEQDPRFVTATAQPGAPHRSTAGAKFIKP